MLDPALFRPDAEAVWQALERRGYRPDKKQFTKLSSQLADARAREQELRQQRNQVSAEIGRAQGEADEALRGRATDISAQLRLTAGELEQVEEQWRHFHLDLPNLPDADVPDGSDEETYQVRAVYDGQGQLQATDWQPAGAGPEHHELGQQLGMLHPQMAAGMSGARFAVLSGALAQLHRALGQFFLNVQVAAGYRECWVPWLVQEAALEGTGQLPKFEEDLFRAGDNHYLLPTAEVALVNLLAGKLLAADEVPVKLTALTPCFRSEAGSYGKDTRGLIRQHQFEKVEIVRLTDAADSEQALGEMVEEARAPLLQLQLPHRVIALCAGDLSVAAAVTLDIEVWMPGQGCWREISSCSNCRDFQTRRLRIRRRPTDGEGKKNQLLHSLNGSGLPLGRCLAALMENFGSGNTLQIPSALRPYMGGSECIKAYSDGELL